MTELRVQILKKKQDVCRQMLIRDISLQWFCNLNYSKQNRHWTRSLKCLKRERVNFQTSANNSCWKNFDDFFFRKRRLKSKYWGTDGSFICRCLFILKSIIYYFDWQVHVVSNLYLNYTHFYNMNFWTFSTRTSRNPYMNHVK